MKQLFSYLKNPNVFKPVALILVILLTIGSYVLYQLRSQRIFIDDSLVDAPIVVVASSIPGKLTEQDIYEGEYVKKGDRLAVVGGQTIYADSDGLVIGANNTIGSTVTTQTSIVQLINPEDMRIAGTLDENKGLETIHVGQVVSFVIDALPGKTFWGYVDEVSPSAKQTQNAFSISSERPTQQFIIYAKFNAAKYPEIKNGMSAKMTVLTNTK